MMEISCLHKNFSLTRLLLVIMLVSFCLYSQAQVDDRFKSKKNKTEQTDSKEPLSSSTESNNGNKTFKDKLVYGGNLNLTFGNNTFIYIAPTIGYKITDNFVSGVGFIYQYAKISRAFNTFTGQFEPVSFESQIYGPKLFYHAFVYDSFYLGAQHEYLNHDVVENFTTGELANQWTMVMFAEVGYVQKLGEKGYIQLGIKYNLLHDYDSPYGSAIVPSFGVFF